MKVAIIDADLIGRKKHRFPNLACMKISGYYKESNHEVVLKTDYNDLSDFDRVFISKVFTDTPIDKKILSLPNVEYGGTGFFYDKAPELPYEIEHSMPDYHLYDEWVEYRKMLGDKSDFRYYTDYSIGYMTRGCFRHCSFCVNQNYNKVVLHSSLKEFYDPSRKKICLLDDNVLGCGYWREVFEELQSTGKSFQFRQGMDERLLTDEKCKVIFSSKYDGEYILHFDNIADYDLIKSKLDLIRQYTDKRLMFYVFCGYDRENRWDSKFWIQDIFDMLKRVKLLQEYHCLPYIMRFARYVESPYQGVYKTMAAWCNQPSFFKRTTLREFGLLSGEKSARYRYIKDFENKFPEFSKYMDMRW